MSQPEKRARSKRSIEFAAGGADFVWIELARQHAYPMVFDPFHFGSLFCGAIVKSGQMKNSMNDIADQFALPGGFECLCLGDGYGNTDKNISCKALGLGGIAIVESNHVRRTLVMKPGLVEALYFNGINQVNAQDIFGK